MRAPPLRPRRQLLALSLPFGLLLTSTSAHADYPIVSHRYLADPGSLVLDGRVYLYNSNDDDNPVDGGYQMKSVVAVSSSDLKNWTDHGEVFRVPRDAEWAGFSWAPCALVRDGTVYLYFGNNASGVGVATSNSPTGPFEDARGGYLVNSSTPGASGASGGWLFDPGALIDDDGIGYLAFGGNGETNARIIQLGQDLVSVTGSAAAFTLPGFFEASVLFKRNGIYYYAYSTNPSNGMRIDYMTSTNPMSGYTYGGVLAPQPPNNSNNNHAYEFELDGQWYHAYHNRFVASEEGIDPGYRRNLGIEVMDFESDGRIVEVEYTRDGVPQARPLDPYTRVEAETTNAQHGIETEPGSQGGMVLTELHDGDWVRVRGVDFGDPGPTSFSASVASTATGGSIELHLSSESGALIGNCEVPNTGGDQNFEQVSCDVSGASGLQDLVLAFVGSSSPLFKVDYWQFEKDPTGTGGTTGTGGDGGMSGATTEGGGSSEGGVDGSGGAPSMGGVLSEGGAAVGLGGAPNEGGAGPSLGGAGVGGTLVHGGAPGTGGGLLGGAPGTGGSLLGGAPSSGGQIGAGGSTLGMGGATPVGGATVGTGGTSPIGGNTATIGGQTAVSLGGAVGTGGLSASAEGISGTAPASAEGATGEAGTCGCRLAPRRPSLAWLGWSGVVLLLSLRRRHARTVRAR